MHLQGARNIQGGGGPGSSGATMKGSGAVVSSGVVASRRQSGTSGGVRELMVHDNFMLMHAE